MTLKGVWTLSVLEITCMVLGNVGFSAQRDESSIFDTIVSIVSSLSVGFPYFPRCTDVPDFQTNFRHRVQSVWVMHSQQIHFLLQEILDKCMFSVLCRIGE